MGILAELDRAGLIDGSVSHVAGGDLSEVIRRNDIMGAQVTSEALENYSSAPGGAKRNLVLGSQETMAPELDKDRQNGCIRSAKTPYSKDGGLVVLFGNIARKGCVVKTAGVDEIDSYVQRRGKEYLHLQEQAADGILAGKIKAGDVVVIIYEGQRAGRECRRCCTRRSTSSPCILARNARSSPMEGFRGGTSGLSIGHVSPEAAAGGEIGLLKSGDIIEIDIPNRKLRVKLSAEELAKRMKAELKKRGRMPSNRSEALISEALKAYALFTTSADRGAVRVVPEP